MSESEMTGNLLFFASAEATKGAEATAPIAAAAQQQPRPEARLVERACGGDREAFGELYRLFAPLVHGIVLARVPRDEADDIAQNVFLSAYKNLHTLRDYNAVGPWLAMIARNYSNEFYRREKPTEELSEDLTHTDAPETEAREILSAIRSLPEAYKETLILRLVEGMTGPEIAAQTGLTPESVRVNLHRGMKLLRRKLGIEE
ncbi:MAG: sigma-70 family RNA polymerase sigma factor [Acidobacteriota bacterium]|nr:sigma-70 family RNA polymerase sigma factor [Acidobacteriota bacterium]